MCKLHWNRSTKGNAGNDRQTARQLVKDLRKSNNSGSSSSSSNTTARSSSNALEQGKYSNDRVKRQRKDLLEADSNLNKQYRELVVEQKIMDDEEFWFSKDMAKAKGRPVSIFSDTKLETTSEGELKMKGNFLLIYICDFHVLSHLLLIYICKLHWNKVHPEMIAGKLLLIYICNFHVLSHLLLIYICKLHWNLRYLSDVPGRSER